MATCTPQPFDTEFIGRPVYRLELGSPTELHLVPDMIPPDAGLVALRVPDTWPGPEPSAGFREIETLVQLQRRLTREDAGNAPGDTRFSTPEDAATCAAIASAAFSADRYHADPMIAEHIAARIKAAWARNEVCGRADRTFVCERNGKVAGFNGCLLTDGVMTIDLIAVSPEHQGKGIGKALLMAAFAHYAPLAQRTIIATQSTNLGALELYRKLGYVEYSRMKTFHYVPEPIGF